MPTILELERHVKELKAGPSSREVSIAITHLETAILWLQKAWFLENGK